ncbi:MAG: hypothetical protein R2876_06635 [Eubacteriales bacterium]
MQIFEQINTINDFIQMVHSLNDTVKTPIHYYSESSFNRIYQGQINIFLEECQKDGLLSLKDNFCFLLSPGINAVKNSNISILRPAYDRAIKRISRLYTDIVI